LSFGKNCAIRLATVYGLIPSSYHVVSDSALLT